MKRCHCFTSPPLTKENEIIKYKKTKKQKAENLSTHDWSTPHLSYKGTGSFIDSGLDNLFCLSVNCGVDSVFNVSAGFEGGLSRLLRKQMSTLQRLICLIRLAAPSIPAFIYLLTDLLTYSFTYLLLGFGLISHPPAHSHPPLFPIPLLILGPDQQDKPSEEGR